MEEKITYTQRKHQEEQERKRQAIAKYQKYLKFLPLILFFFFLFLFVLFFFSDTKEKPGEYYQTQNFKQQGVIVNRKDNIDYSKVYLTRGELVSLLIFYLKEDLSEPENQECFRDIVNSEYKKGICLAVEKGWLQGKSDGLFYPNDIINHAQGLKLILNFLGENVPQEAYENTYKDIDRTFWYATYAEYAKRKGIIEKNVEYFYPEESISLEKVDEYVRKIEKIQKK